MWSTMFDVGLYACTYFGAQLWPVALTYCMFALVREGPFTPFGLLGDVIERGPGEEADRGAEGCMYPIPEVANHLPVFTAFLN